MEDKLADLKGRLAEVQNLSRAANVLEWDQQVWMPPGGARGRAEQMAALSGLAHRLFVSAEVGDLLHSLGNGAGAGWAYDSVEASMVRMARRQYDRSTRVPNELVARISRAASLGHQTWVRARAENNFALFRPGARGDGGVETRVRRVPEAVGPSLRRAARRFRAGHEDGRRGDALRRREGGPGGTGARDPREPAPGVRRGAAQDLRRRGQRAVGREFAGLLGYDFQRGRLDGRASVLHRPSPPATCASPRATTATTCPARSSA